MDLPLPEFDRFRIDSDNAAAFARAMAAGHRQRRLGRDPFQLGGSLAMRLCYRKPQPAWRSPSWSTKAWYAWLAAPPTPAPET
jgi:hypothetical protein